jgi:hypothetical protein
VGGEVGHCAFIAAGATAIGPPINLPTATACQAVDVIQALQSGDWLGEVPGMACGLFADLVATSGAIAAGGTASPTGPGAAVVGVATYRAILTGLKLVCGALFDGGAYDFGVWLEGRHQTNVAVDIRQHGECLREEVRFGLINWSAVDCT